MSEADDEIVLAEEALDDLDAMGEVSIRRKYTTLYFAAYHAARAALLSMEYAPKTHSGIDSLVHNILVKDRGVLQEGEAALFSKLKSRRDQADYETGFYGSEEEFEDLLPRARDLVNELTAIAQD